MSRLPIDRLWPISGETPKGSRTGCLLGSSAKPSGSIDSWCHTPKGGHGGLILEIPRSLPQGISFFCFFPLAKETSLIIRCEKCETTYHLDQKTNRTVWIQGSLQSLRSCFLGRAPFFFILRRPQSSKNPRDLASFSGGRESGGQADTAFQKIVLDFGNHPPIHPDRPDCPFFLYPISSS